jgi:predicted nucleic acid-binding Zn ribbon protein
VARAPAHPPSSPSPGPDRVTSNRPPKPGRARGQREPGGAIVRRSAPRPLSVALEQVARAAAPATLLARVQAAWPQVAGRTVAAVAAPVAEREGVVTVVCESAVWSGELELLARDLLARLNADLAPDEEAPVGRLRFVIGSLPNRP